MTCPEVQKQMVFPIWCETRWPSWHEHLWDELECWLWARSYHTTSLMLLAKLEQIHAVWFQNLVESFPTEEWRLLYQHFNACVFEMRCFNNHKIFGCPLFFLGSLRCDVASSDCCSFRVKTVTRCPLNACLMTTVSPCNLRFIRDSALIVSAAAVSNGSAIIPVCNSCI